MAYCPAGSYDQQVMESKSAARHTTLATLVAAMFAVGCSSSDPEPTEGTTGGNAGAGGSTQSVPCEPTDGVDLEGTWAMLARYSLKLDSQTGGVVTMCPENQFAPAFLLTLVDIRASDAPNTFTATTIPCDLELPSVSAMVGECRPDQGNLLGVEIPIPDTLVQSLGGIPPVIVDGSRNDQALAFAPMRFTWGSRADLLPTWQSEQSGCGMTDTDAGRAALCETACVNDCEQVLDDDGDGYPGVTVHVCGTTQDDVDSKVPCNAEDPTTPGVTLQGLIRMVFRTELELDGATKSSCEASGTFASETTYSVVGADAYLTSTRVSVASALQSLPLFEGVKPDSIWRMVRVDGRYGAPDWQLPSDAAARCAQARSRRNELE